MGLFFRNNASDYCKYKRSIDIKRIHASYNNDLLNTNTSIAIVDTHEGKPFYDKRKDIIYLDMHFFDYSRIVGAALLTGNISVMRTLGYACAADYYLCKDTIYLALHYAKMFAKEKEDIAFLLNTTEQGAYDAFFRELLFIIGHEQGHALLAYNREDRGLVLFENILGKRLKVKIALQNKSCLLTLTR